MAADISKAVANAISTTATAAADIQIMATAVMRMAGDAASLELASGTKAFIPLVAYDAERASQLAMELAAEVSEPAVNESTLYKMNNELAPLMKSIAEELGQSVQLITQWTGQLIQKKLQESLAAAVQKDAGNAMALCRVALEAFNASQAAIIEAFGNHTVILDGKK